MRTRTGLELDLRPVTPADHGELHRLFRAVVAAGEGYPQHPDRPVSRDDFAAYWLAPAALAVVARAGPEPARAAGSGELVGAYMMKPNGVGRAAHVANAGYIVRADRRGQGIGELLVRHSMAEGRRLGFDALQFNFVFESNPARRLYERLGFEVVGRVPEVIDGEAVLIYWRRLDDADPAPGG
jgi:ribosomal protein S18 acetylase RimI-like enzyme